MNLDYTLIIKYLFEDLTEAEMEVLLQWRNESAANKELFTALMKLRLSHKYRDVNTPERTLKALGAINKKLKKKQSYSILRFTRYAAIFLLLLSISYGVANFFSNQPAAIRITVAPGESIKKFPLSDGTVVWLNENSTLKIPHDFSDKKRTLELEGEAYFDVKKNISSPFLVDASSMKVKVLGTSFNLKNRKESGLIETILVSGKVQLLDEKNIPAYEMFPGEKVTYSPERNEYTVKTVDTNVSTAWHLNQLRFENAALREIVNKLSLIYDVNINLESKKLADRKYRCVINRDETLEQVLDILSYLAPIKYKIEGDEVFIYE